MTTVANAIEGHKTSVLSDETAAAILERYLYRHGPATDQQLASVLQSATEAVVSLACFMMVMQGRAMPENGDHGVRYSMAPDRSRSWESIGDILHQLVAEVGS